MTEQKIHVAQAKHNTEFLEKISSETSFYDWIATVMFYTALQYTDSFFAFFIKVHPNGHTERFTLLSMNDKTFSPTFYNSYMRLFNASMTARYHPDEWRAKLNTDRINTLRKDLDVVKFRK